MKPRLALTGEAIMIERRLTSVLSGRASFMVRGHNIGLEAEYLCDNL